MAERKLSATICGGDLPAGESTPCAGCGFWASPCAPSRGSEPSANCRDARCAGRRQQRLSHTTPLTNPLNDARDMAAALKSVGFDVVEALDADRRKLDGAMRAFTDKLASADVALFFYAGHGLQARVAELSRADRCQARARARPRVRDGEARIRAPPDGDRARRQDDNRHPGCVSRQPAVAQSRALDGYAVDVHRARAGGGIDRARHLHRLLDAAGQRRARRPGAQLALHGGARQAHGRPRGAICRRR